METSPGEKKSGSENQPLREGAYDPDELVRRMERIVLRSGQRKYYRLARPGKWYGGIATADCCGCNLRCAFCWSGKPRDDCEHIGSFYEPVDVARALINTARKYRYRQVRISGNEPTLSQDHLLRILHIVDQAGLKFILETNGLLVDPPFARALSASGHLHARISLKGTHPEEFSRLTGASPEIFFRQLTALENLLAAGVSCHPAVMTSFCLHEDISHLRQTLRAISPNVAADLEEETIILYPHVRERLRRAGLHPREAH